ncbi:MAG: aspartate/glutamate racemase family protein [bacterium]
MSKKTIGILGGMGPAATVYFIQKVVELTPATIDQEHIPMIVFNNPEIPDRTQAIIGDGENPSKALERGIDLLVNAGADFICVPCNTAHYFLKDVIKRKDILFLDLIDCVVEDTLNTAPAIAKAGVLATRGTIASRLYQDAFHEHGVATEVPNELEMLDLQKAIRGLKNKEKESTVINKMAEHLMAKGSQAIILGCTELSLVADSLRVKVPVIDSTEVLAKKVIAAALQTQALPVGSRPSRWFLP